MTIKRKSTEASEQPAKKFKNTETFAYATDVNEIPKERLLILDGFAFDVEELKMLPEKDIFINIHTQTEFSADARRILLGCPALKQKAENHLRSLTAFPDALIKDMYDLGTILIGKGASQESGNALASFKHKLENEYAEFKAKLLHFPIKMTTHDSKTGKPRLAIMTVETLLTELDKGKLCVRVGGHWSVQFVRMQKPHMVDEDRVKHLTQQATIMQPRVFMFSNPTNVNVMLPDHPTVASIPVFPAQGLTLAFYRGNTPGNQMFFFGLPTPQPPQRNMQAELNEMTRKVREREIALARLANSL